MSSRTRVAFSKKLALSLLAPVLLTGWVIVPMSEAGFQSNFFMSDNGTGYFAFKDDGAVGDPAHVNTVGVGASTSGVSGSTTSVNSDPLQADVSITPLFAATSVKHTGTVSCTLPGTFDAAANGGAGKWTLGAVVIDGFADADLAFTLSAGGGGLPAATAVGGSRYRFNGAGLTTSLAKGAGFAADGFSMTSGQCVVMVLNSSSLLTPGTTLFGAGAVSGFLGNSSAACTGGTGDFACATAAKQDNDSVSLAATTTTTTTTTVIPTVGNWGMMILGLAFLGAITWMLKARRSLFQS